MLLAACGRIGFDPDPGAAGLCSFDRVTIVDDAIAIDDAVGAQVASSLAGACANAPVTRTISQDDPGVLDPAGRPLLPADELIVIGGGDGPNRAIAYLLTVDTPIVWGGDPNVTITERRTGHTIVHDTISSSHDYVMLMVVHEPIGGTTTLSAQGLTSPGTTAAGDYFVSAPRTDDTWTVVEWNAPDSFTPIASGS